MIFKVRDGRPDFCWWGWEPGAEMYLDLISCLLLYKEQS